MGWNTIIGQSLQKRVLQKAVASDRLAHAYLFSGPEGTGKESVAFELAKVLNCEYRSAAKEGGSCGSCRSCREIDAFMHQDIEYVFPVESVLFDTVDPSKTESKRISDAKERYHELIEQKKLNPYCTPAMDRAMGILTEQVITLQQKASFMPAGKGKKVFILSQPEKLLASAANKLLKLLEEPPAHVLFILVSSRPEKVLPTIRSRCQVLSFSRITSSDLDKWLRESHPELQDDMRQFIINFSRGNLRVAVDLVNSMADGDTSAFEGLIIRDRAIEFLRRVLSPGKLAEAITMMEDLSKNLGKQELVALLGSLLLFFQDIRHKTIDPDWQSLNNPDLSDAVNRFAQNFPNPDFLELSTTTENAIRSIQRNVNPVLTLSEYAIRLKSLLRRT